MTFSLCSVCSICLLKDWAPVREVCCLLHPQTPEEPAARCLLTPAPTQTPPRLTVSCCNTNCDVNHRENKPKNEDVLISMLSFVLNETRKWSKQEKHSKENQWLKKMCIYVFPVFKSEMNDVCVWIPSTSHSSRTSLLGSEVLNRLLKCFLLYVTFGAVCNVSWFAEDTLCILSSLTKKGLSSAQIFICVPFIDVNLVFGL